MKLIKTYNKYSKSNSEFTKKVSNNYKNPVLIKGFMIYAPALRNWTPEYLNKQIDKNFLINCL